MADDLELSEIDARILRVLEEDGRASGAKLAEAVGVSSSTCQRRVKELEKKRVIRSYRAQIDPAALGRGCTVFAAVKLARPDAAKRRGFVKGAADLAAVTEIHHVAGPFDYLLRIELPDMASYGAFETEALGRVAGLGEITSLISLLRHDP